MKIFTVEKFSASSGIRKTGVHWSFHMNSIDNGSDSLDPRGGLFGCLPLGLGFNEPFQSDYALTDLDINGCGIQSGFLNKCHFNLSRQFLTLFRNTSIRTKTIPASCCRERKDQNQKTACQTPAN